jgi:hypothetical protein
LGAGTQIACSSGMKKPERRASLAWTSHSGEELSLALLGITPRAMWAATSSSPHTSKGARTRKRSRRDRERGGADRASGEGTSVTVDVSNRAEIGVVVTEEHPAQGVDEPGGAAAVGGEEGGVGGRGRRVATQPHGRVRVDGVAGGLDGRIVGPGDRATEQKRRAEEESWTQAGRLRRGGDAPRTYGSAGGLGEVSPWTRPEEAAAAEPEAAPAAPAAGALATVDTDSTAETELRGLEFRRATAHAIPWIAGLVALEISLSVLSGDALAHARQLRPPTRTGWVPPLHPQRRARRSCFRSCYRSAKASWWVWVDAGSCAAGAAPGRGSVGSAPTRPLRASLSTRGSRMADVECSSLPRGFHLPQLRGPACRGTLRTWLRFGDQSNQFSS